MNTEPTWLKRRCKNSTNFVGQTVELTFADAKGIDE